MLFLLQYLHEEQKILPDKILFSTSSNCCGLREKTGERTVLEQTTSAKTQARDKFEQTDWLKTKQNQIRYLLLLQNLIGSQGDCFHCRVEFKRTTLSLLSDSNPRQLIICSK